MAAGYLGLACQALSFHGAQAVVPPSLLFLCRRHAVLVLCSAAEALLPAANHLLFGQQAPLGQRGCAATRTDACKGFEGPISALKHTIANRLQSLAFAGFVCFDTFGSWQWLVCKYCP
jgi:hypothetical protein